MSEKLETAPQLSGRAMWAAVLAVALGIFTLMTSELLPVGLLTPVGSALRVSDGAAGLMVTVPGLVAAVSAPLVIVLLGRVDRRWMLVGLVSLVGIANLASAFATHFGIVLAARFLVGVSVGGFWAIAGGLALRLVPERYVPQAMGLVFGGVSAASVVGVPLGTLIGDLGDLGGWRTAFAAVGLLGLAAAVALLILLPALPSQGSIGFGSLAGLLRDGAGVRAGLAATVLLVTGQFAGYTFVRPILRELSGVDGELVGVLLLLYGLAGLGGNALAGLGVLARHGRKTLAGLAIALSAVMLLLSVAGAGVMAAIGLLALWGLAYGAVPVTLQRLMLAVAPAAPEAASAWFVTCFNLSIASGALLGGLAVDRLSTAGALWIGSALVLLTALVMRKPFENKEELS